MTLLPAVVLAQSRPQTHDGFFLRLSVGPAFAASTVGHEDEDHKVQGGGSSTSIAIGGMIATNLALHADFFGAVLVDPPVYIDGAEAGHLEGRYSGGGVGIGITYYFMPSNLYLCGSVGPTVLRARVGGLELESEPGVGFNFMLGKEWWVADDWGIGIAGQFVYSNIPSRFDTVNNSYAAGVLFSATYN